MARIFELSTRLKTISRGDGRSATAAAAYRACCLIECDREGKVHDYRRKGGLEATEIILPPDAPAWAKDRAKLWNEAEARERNKDSRAKSPDKAKAQTAREAFYSFPAELSQEGRLHAARIITLHMVTTHGVAAEFSIHQPGKNGDERNYHCHMLMTTRRVTAEGLSAKAREWDDRKTGPALTRSLRAFIAKTLNDGLAAEGKGHLVFVEHRSFKNRGSSQKPMQHQGPTRTNVQRKQLGRLRAAWIGRERTEQHERHGRELDSLTARHESGLKAKDADLHRRGGEAAKTIKRELDAARAADRKPDGWRRALTVLTGRAGREASERQARGVQRVAAARQKLADLKAGLRAERQSYGTAQAQERAVLIERHGREDRQLAQALEHRAQRDRVVEVRTRTPANDRDQAHKIGAQERGDRSIGRE